MEGIYKELILSTNDSKKRILSTSISSATIAQTSKRMNSRQSNYSIITATETQNNINDSQLNSDTLDQTSSQTQRSNSLEETASSTNELTIDKMIKMANKNQFPNKLITVGNDEHYYTTTLNFFEFVDKYTKFSEENVAFKCKICNNTFHAVIGKTRNLNKHLNTHESLDDWHKKYSAYMQNIYFI